MTTIKDIIDKFLNGVRGDAIADLQAKEISQGDLGMTVISTETSGELTGYEYWYYLVHGRRPGKQPPIDSILGWLQKKGIHGEDITDRSLAYLIARKIGQVGTDIFQGKRPGLALPAIINSRMVGLEEDIEKHYAEQIDSAIMAGLNSIFRSN